MSKNIMISHSKLIYMLRYDADTGNFIWINPLKFSGCKIGSIAGSACKRGYIYIKINGIKYSAHRLAILYTTGMAPTEQIDHIDGNKSNNSILNLREATPQQQMFNTPTFINNTSGIRGVSWHKCKKKWFSQIKIGGKIRSLGYNDDFMEAVFTRFFAEQCTGWHNFGKSSAKNYVEEVLRCQREG